jgi:hypothetical protein
MSPVSKSFGPFTLSVTDKGNGVFEGAVSLNASVGGGQAAGVVKAGGSLYADLSAEQVAELGFEEFNKILPASVVPLAEAGEAAAEAEIGKL